VTRGNGDWTGTVDLTTVVTLTGSLQTLGDNILGTDCPLGPFTIHTTTTNSGGAPYYAGAATVAIRRTRPGGPDGTPGAPATKPMINLARPPGTGGATIARAPIRYLRAPVWCQRRQCRRPRRPADERRQIGRRRPDAEQADGTCDSLPVTRRRARCRYTGSSTMPLVVLGVGLSARARW
jgi:hypothetical protein